MGGDGVVDRAAAELAGAYVAMVSDALDRLGRRDRVLAPGVLPLGRSRVAGTAFPIVLAASDEIRAQPYEGDIAAFERIRPGDVLVYGGECAGAAVFGELFAHAAIGRGAIGAVVDGPIRDSEQLLELAFPVFSRGVSPLDTAGRTQVVGWGEQTVCAGVTVASGDFVIADADGVVVVPAALIAEVSEMLPDKRRDEAGAREDIKAGVGIQDVWDRWKAF